MYKRIEFYNSPDGSINIKPQGESVRQFNEKCDELVQEILDRIKSVYPKAYKALSEMYSVSMLNKSYFEFRIVSRFIRCNFGEYDSLTYDIDGQGNFNIEMVKCPLRGECKFEGVICRPEVETNLTPKEAEVVQLLLEGFQKDEIADELQMSPYTVTRHFANIRQRVGLKTTAQIIAHFKDGIR